MLQSTAVTFNPGLPDADTKLKARLRIVKNFIARAGLLHRGILPREKKDTSLQTRSLFRAKIIFIASRSQR